MGIITFFIFPRCLIRVHPFLALEGFPFSLSHHNTVDTGFSLLFHQIYALMSNNIVDSLAEVVSERPECE